MSLNTLNTLYYVFFVLTIVFFLISVLLFFVFDIRRIFMIRSGKAAKRDIKKLEEESFKTGTLSKYNSANSVYGNTGSFADSGEFGRSRDFAKTEQMGISGADAMLGQGGGKSQAVAVSGTNETTVLGQNETTVLNEEFTTVLNAGATTVLNQGMAGAAHQNRKFEIIKRDVHIHTEEVI